MDRIIKYRGKRIDSNEWVYGYYFKDKDGNSLIKVIEESFTSAEYNEKIILELDYEVIPETVGQYIGLNDRYKKEIFEDDITRVYSGEYCQGYYEYDNRCIAKWQTCGFDMVVIKEGYGIGLGFCDNSEYIEILGNKTDNPELLQK